ncbi:uncharacterized protein STEHIDRAFT_151278 [Stereum hirsutum FP-91666 SS1]|uniref:uncharacterized protein n=1 Tax=Stereum hirsutum (strain FP-91666) TaxID=721885 RepID=UPI000440FCF9|nr:uncharacterized protein STEHIDRAFT_151278 [Stereum hirsutum FP-91666 SS1]EIM91923.1 hypothetical protein STEHIDRAFT_151278 [Stereum hirsutum FP-91666 SS1]
MTAPLPQFTDRDDAIQDSEGSSSPLQAPLTDPGSQCHSNSHERPAVTTRKRKRDGTATTPPPRRSTGPPRPFNHIPKEIFLEVVHHLQPIDLLQLARTSKQFRAILLSHSTALDWDVAYENIGAPPFPRDVSAPAWTYFLFDHNKCDFCDKTANNTGFIALDFVSSLRMCHRASLCPSAADEVLTSDDALRILTGLDPILLSCIPAIPKRIVELRHNKDADLFWKRQVEAAKYKVEQIIAAVSDPAHVQNVLQEFIMAETKRLEEKEPDDELYEHWFQSVKAARSEKREANKIDRQAQIKARCLEMGYTEADFKKINTHKEVRNEKPLTERVWERVKAIIEPLLAQHKAERLRIERVGRFIDRLRLLEEVCVDLIEWLDIPGFPEPTGYRGPLADNLDEAITKPLTDRSRNHSWHLYLPDHRDILEQLPALQSLILADDDSSDSTMQQRMRAILSERFYDHEETEQQWLPKHWIEHTWRQHSMALPSNNDEQPSPSRAHATPQSNIPNFQLLNTSEEFQAKLLDRETSVRYHRDKGRDWGCELCIAHLTRHRSFTNWFTREEVCAHVVDA